MQIKSSLYLSLGAAMLLCSCGTPQTQWGKDSLYSEQEVADMKQESRGYLHKLWESVMTAHSISLEKTTIRNGKKETQRIQLNRHELSTMRVLVCRMRSVKQDRMAPPAPETETTRLICTDKNGKQLFAEEVHVVPHSSVSKDGYAVGACIELPDEYFTMWQHIINRETCEVSPQEDAVAAQQHQQAVDTLQEQLKHCAAVEVLVLGQTYYFVRMHTLKKQEVQELCTLLQRVKPLPFKGRVHGLADTETILFFIDAAGRQIGSLRVEAITNTCTPQQCEAKESMYLSRRDYKRLHQLIIKP